MNLLEPKAVPRIASVAVDNGEITVALAGVAVEGAKLVFPAHSLRPLREATDEQLKAVEVQPSGGALLWRALDVDYSAVSLIEAVTGVRHTKHDFVAAGSIGGQTRSEAKAAAAKINGVGGGRPTCRKMVLKLVEEKGCSLEELIRGWDGFSISDGMKKAARQLIKERDGN